MRNRTKSYKKLVFGYCSDNDCDLKAIEKYYAASEERILIIEIRKVGNNKLILRHEEYYSFSTYRWKRQAFKNVVKLLKIKEQSND